MITKVDPKTNRPYDLEVYTDGAYKFKVIASSYYINNILTGKHVYHAESWYHYKNGYKENARFGEIRACKSAMDYILNRYDNLKIYYGLDYDRAYYFLIGEEDTLPLPPEADDLMKELEIIKLRMLESNNNFYLENLQSHSGIYGNTQADRLSRLVIGKADGYYHVDVMSTARNISKEKCIDLRLPAVR